MYLKGAEPEGVDGMGNGVGRASSVLHFSEFRIPIFEISIERMKLSLFVTQKSVSCDSSFNSSNFKTFSIIDKKR